MSNSKLALAGLGGFAAGALAYYMVGGSGASVETNDTNKCSKTSQEGATMAELSNQILADLKRWSPVKVEDMPEDLHYLAPHVPKTAWTALGDQVAAREKNSSTQKSIDGSRWISLRLDGSNFSKTVRALRNKGLLEGDGYSDRFAECMIVSMESLMQKFGAKIGYTQSDEMVVFIEPAKIVRGEQNCHARNGRVTKITTLAAGYVTARFITKLSDMCSAEGIDAKDLGELLPHFDCRLGSYASWEEARALMMWRAYDCSVNGVSDAVYQIKGSGKTIMGLGKREKVEWLWKNNHLPLPRHQAYGTVKVKVKRFVDKINEKTGEPVRPLRSVVETVDGPVLELMRTETLIPESEEEIAASQM